jgi:RNA polymerase sigma factor for flagellar operon FliA
VEQRFDPSRGVPFEAFVYRRVRGAMIDGLRVMWKDNALIQAACRRVSRMEGVADEAEKELQEDEPSDDAEAKADVLDAGIGKLIASSTLTYVSEIEKPGSSEDERITDLDIVRVRRAVRSLSRNARKLIKALYVDELTEEDTARLLESSRSRVQRMHNEVLTELREKLTLTNEAPDGR